MPKKDEIPTAPARARRVASPGTVFGLAGGPRDAKAGDWIVPNEDGTFRLEPAGAFAEPGETPAAGDGDEGDEG